MTIPPVYSLNNKIVQLLSEIEANKAVIENINASIELEQNIRRQSVLGSAIFSARIEGNPLTSGEIQSFADLSGDDQKKLEISNLFRVIERFSGKGFQSSKKVTVKNLFDWHAGCMNNILGSGHLGAFRREHEGLFDAAGNAIYHAPPPEHVAELVDELLIYANRSKEKIIPIRAMITHLVFEKIHPFVDGNGRVGRLLQQAILMKNGYKMKGLVVVEEDIDKNRQDYYRAIEEGVGANCQSFVELMLEFLRDSSKRAKENLQLKVNSASSLDLLLPRRKEIVEIIKDQKMVSFDFLRRRFMKVGSRQLAYDLTSLIKSDYIVRHGSTRGALYAPKNL